MSLCSRFLEDARRDLRKADREMRRQLRLMDLHSRYLCTYIHPHCLCSVHLHPHCLCELPPYPHRLCEWNCRPSCLTVWERRAIKAKLEAERELASERRRINRMLSSCHDHKLLALMDVKGFDPEEVTVKVKDGKVKLLAEHEEEYRTLRGKEYNYKNITKEINLPPGVDEDEVMYTVGPNSIVKIETPRRCYPCLLSL
ncbi:PREDICTED: outer dense fiber protein 1 [Gavialis gangeticus]|uniref:outer dense fiber protein 1 n=1 Tax=Gavialis gangeticus TaxID=94835 RepID=UPI00092EAA7F|nr:PREDICTED: outer dense fiber protein 1 [Gavialis gangeticus]